VNDNKNLTMDKTEAINIAQKYAETVKRNFAFQKFILFGSYTKGNPRKDSDIDIAIVFSDYDNRLDRQVELMKLTRNVDSRIEPHPFRAKEFEISNPFVNEILTYGEEIKAF
jgi:predicted nucleotidyltransferase